jgi:hypothetical protein
MRLTVLVLFLVFTPARLIAADSAQQIVDKSIAYHGGSIYTSSETSMVITSKSGTFELTSKVSGGTFDHRVTRVRNGREEFVRLTNDSVEVTALGETTLFEGESAERLTRFIYERVYFPFLPYRLNDPGVIKTDLGHEVWNGRTLRKIKITFEGAAADGDEYVYWFDPATGRLEQYAYSFSNNAGGLRLRRGFDYRRVGGLLFFDSENIGLSGTEHSVDEITPEFVASKMATISTVKLSDVAVRRLSD